jgi:hypothetical protein
VIKLVVGYISLGVAVFTLFIAILIHSETREALKHINTITYTLPGAYDIDRLKGDIERTGEIRGKVMCVASKHTHIAWYQPSLEKVPRAKRALNEIWRFIRNLSSGFSGNIDIPVDAPHDVSWDITSCQIKSPEADRLLTLGWEPFSISNDDKVWLRKEVTAKEKREKALSQD